MLLKCVDPGIKNIVPERQVHLFKIPVQPLEGKQKDSSQTALIKQKVQISVYLERYLLPL